MGIAYLVCYLCISFATKMNKQLNEVDKKLEELKSQVSEN
jgi:uncharacterized protein YoxC